MRFSIAGFLSRDGRLLCSGACGAIALAIAISSNAPQIPLTDLDPDELRSVSYSGAQVIAQEIQLGAAKGADQRPATPAQNFSNLLGSKSILVTNSAVQRRWDGVLAEAADRELLSACAYGADICKSPRLLAMRHKIERLRGASLDEQIAAVNEFVNAAFRYAPDSATYGASDHWASLREFLLHGQGDCEDFAIAKFWMLVALGVPPRSLRIVVLRDTATRADHAVLAVDNAGSTAILDNRSRAVRRDDELGHYRPIYSMSAAAGIWVHVVTALNVAQASEHPLQ